MYGKFVWADGNLEVTLGQNPRFHRDIVRNMVDAGSINWPPDALAAGMWHLSDFHPGLPVDIEMTWEIGTYPDPALLAQMIEAEVKSSGKIAKKLYDLPDNSIGPHKEVQNLAKDYMDQMGMVYNPPETFQEVDPERAARIADEYDKMQHDPHNPEVNTAYNALAEETLMQYLHLVENGFHFEFYPPGVDPYPAGPQQAIQDLHENKHLFVYPTSEGFGHDADNQDHPLLTDSGVRWNGQPVTFNDLFRAVHDVYGHAKEGLGFRHHGEENAWRQHASMFSSDAQKALASETRGQNSWVNFGPYGEQNQSADQMNTVYAPQKAGLMPEWTWTQGLSDSDFAKLPGGFKSLSFPHLTLLPGGGEGDRQRFEPGDKVTGAPGSKREGMRGYTMTNRDEDGVYLVQWYPVDSEPEWRHENELLPYGYSGPHAAATKHGWIIEAADSPIWNTPFSEFEMPKGLPRPIWKNMPVPYTSEIAPTNRGQGTKPAFPAMISPSKIYFDFLNQCLVCGEQLTDPVYLFYAPPLYQGQRGVILDGGGLHQRCAALTEAHCPHIRMAGYEVVQIPLIDWPELIQGSKEPAGESISWPTGWEREPLESKTAKWPDIMEKAMRYRADGRINLVLNSPNHVVAECSSETRPGQVYDTEIWMDEPDKGTITLWACNCEWGTYSWGRTRQWKKYEGRPCVHTLATYWESTTQPKQETQDQLSLLPPDQYIQQTLPSTAPATPVDTGPPVVVGPQDANEQLAIPGTLGKWKRLATFENGDYVRTNQPVSGEDDRGTEYIVPRNMIGEVIWADEEEAIVIFSIESGRLGPHNVRVTTDPANFSYVPRQKGTAPRRRR